jgi:lysyl-tRNA synthetase, class I
MRADAWHARRNRTQRPHRAHRQRDPVRDRLRPLGPAHIGTFGEVSRTTMVRHAFATLSDVPTRLIVLLRRHGRASQGARQRAQPRRARPPGARPAAHPVPDPFGKFESFGHHNNAMLRQFLDQFGFDYEFALVDRLLRLGPLRRGAAAHARMLRRGDGDHAAEPAPGARSRPIRPSCRCIPITGIVMQVPIEERRLRRHHRLARPRLRASASRRR